ncbi:MAG: hypothetical protein HYX63_13515 [Gammaproteobacteria bacterium]|nr:hypothetical protein [Gammaproteobacteria bacterium]
MPELPKFAWIEALTRVYADRLNVLNSAMQDLEDELRLVKRRRLKNLRDRVQEVADAKAELTAAIAFAPALFEKPRTQQFHGIKVGLQKGKGALIWDDDAKVCERIEKYYVDEIGVLIKTTKKPIKEGLEKLSAAELKRLGIEQIKAGDQVVIKSTIGDIEKLVDALIGPELTELAEVG